MSSRVPLTEGCATSLKKNKGIGSVEKAFEILNAILQNGGSARLVDIARATGISTNLIHPYLVSLQRARAVIQDGSTGRYSLGSALVQLGFSVLAQSDLSGAARDMMISLRDEVGETVLLTVWGPAGPICVAKIDGVHSSSFEPRIGSIGQLTATAAGGVFVAYLEEEMWRELLDTELDEMGKAAPSRRWLTRRILETRRIGACIQAAASISDTEMRKLGLLKSDFANFASLGAPVFDYSGAVRAAIVILGPSQRIDVSEEGRDLAAILSAAKKISARMGQGG